MFPWYAVSKIFALTPWARAAASGSTLGRENGLSLVAVVLTQSPEPANATSSTSTPSSLYQPNFVATAKGAAAEEIVREQKPTRSFDVCAGTVTHERDRKSTRLNSSH